MFAYAASYFGDADAQYQLGRLYLDGSPGDPRQAARWFQLAATKGDCRAEAVLGDMLFHGQHVPRQAARGLMWLTLGRDCAGTDDNWIKPLYENAFHRANDDERAAAFAYLEDWLKGSRPGAAIPIQNPGQHTQHGARGYRKIRRDTGAPERGQHWDRSLTRRPSVGDQSGRAR